MRTDESLLEEQKRGQSAYFKIFSVHHVAWMKEVIAAYKAYGHFPLYPTFIANYYSDVQDKEIALLSTLCLNWKKAGLPQVKAMCEVMGEHPYEWFCGRGFVVLSIGKRQESKIMDRKGRKYWKVAQFFSRLYDLCGQRPLRTVFRSGSSSKSRTRLVNFGRMLEEELGFIGCESNAGVLELVLRASDGISFGLWPTDPSKIKCPSTADVKRCLGTWFPDFRRRVWTFDDAVSLFGLENDYDFFYFHLAWEQLRKVNGQECSLYSTRYIRRYNDGTLLPPSSWTGSHGQMPKIKFE